MRKRRLIGSTVGILAMALLCAVLATLLPDNPYQRFQQLDGTLYGMVRWIYERIHFDDRPIDVAIIGDSRTLLSQRASEIEADLAAAGKPANVVNMSLVADGRDSEWILVQELLKAKKPKVLVVAITERPFPWGHPSFQYIAPASEIWGEASHGLHDAGKDLIYLPFRQLKLFGANLSSNIFGSDAFDRAAYARTRHDFTTSYMSPDGRWIEMTRPVPRATLETQAASHTAEFRLQSHYPAALRRVTDDDNRVYTDRIAAAAAKQGVKLLFVYVPTFHGPTKIENRAYYERLGKVLDNADLGDRDELFQGWAHLNSAGAVVASQRTAAAVAELLPEPPPASPKK